MTRIIFYSGVRARGHNFLTFSHRLSHRGGLIRIGKTFKLTRGRSLLVDKVIQVDIGLLLPLFTDFFTAEALCLRKTETLVQVFVEL